MEAVKVKGVKGGIKIVIDDKACWSSVIEELEKKLNMSFFNEGKVFLELGERKLSKEEYKLIDELFYKKPFLKLVGVKALNPITRKVVKEFLPQVYPQEESKVFPSFHIGTLRSGSSLECKGNLVIIGDVNPGAEVRVGGSLLVFGALRGSAYVGMEGEGEVVVAALKLSPSLLVLKGRIISIPSNVSKDKPALILFSDEKISFQPIRGG
ncbi:MAG: hypothetical protein N3C62_00165 [Synergistetes bacterium]|nr:hypothetical protein [Synergistota bacterium]MCX8127151.1 hypothetical protein [Synergistota bacterium]MDW8191963.1 septum site-determining protein MinC [Synergistota bacterium]